MIIGIPKEIKTEEFRVGMTPVGARELAKGGHTVLIESGAGDGSGFIDDEYHRAGAEITDRDSVFLRAELLVKVKEPLAVEYPLLRTGGTIFTYLHLAPNPELTRHLLDKRIPGLAYETL